MGKPAKKRIRTSGSRKNVYYELGGLLFEWNAEKARRNASKHGITFETAITVFLDPLEITALDQEHSDDEERYVTIGTTTEGTCVVVFHTDRNNRLRIISAREPTAREQKEYEKDI